MAANLYDPTGHTAGEECSSTYEGRHLTFEESQLVHPSHTDGFVDSKDPVLVGDNIVGVAFKGAAAATDLIAIDTEGIFFLNVVATSAMNQGAVVFIDATTAILSDDSTDVVFGTILSALGASQTAQLVAVKVHSHPVGADTT